VHPRLREDGHRSREGDPQGGAIALGQRSFGRSARLPVREHLERRLPDRRHPEFENVWLAGGGSGHGFEHGPALGEYLAARIVGSGPVETRFSLATKPNRSSRERTVY
jgi:glycine/D-amino acid oxidase-like deaminating enzyme